MCLTEEHAKPLARIVLDFGIPAMIFVNLAGATIGSKELLAPLILIAVELCMIALAWSIGKRLRMTLPQLGALVLCSTFGTSATLGYSIISIVFPNNHDAMMEAVLISEIGVGYVVLTLGPLLAMYFGSGEVSGKRVRLSLINFIKTPIFIALIVGLCWGLLGLPGEEHTFMQPFFQVGHILGGVVAPLAVLVVSLNLRKPKLRPIFAPLGVVVGLKLLLSPVLAGLGAMAFTLPEVWRDDLVILAGVPPAVLSVIFLQRYGGDAGLASTLVAGATVLSIGTILIVIALVG